MGKKGERGAKDKSAAQEEEARNAARRAEHGEEEYVCSGALELDFPELCARAGLQEAPRVVSRPHPPAGGPPEEPEGAGGAWAAGEQREALSALAQIQAKYAYFRPAVQVELEHEDPKSAREVFIRSWKIEEKMLGILAKCLPALAHLQALHLWKVGLSDSAFLSLLPVLAACANLKTFVLEGNPLPERSFYRLVSEESSSNKNLVSINLSYNHITDVGATHLANGLRLNRSLLSLSLAHNQIGDEGALKLAELAACLQVLGPFALTHTEVVERRRLLLEKEAQERGRLPQRHSELKSDRPASHVSSTTIDKLQTAKGAKAVVKKKEPTKKEEKGPAGGAAPAQPPAAPAAQAKKEDAKQSKKAVPPVDPKAKGAKGVKLGSKDKRSQVLEVEQILEPTEMMNPLLEPAEHREGQVFLQGNRVLIYLNLMQKPVPGREQDLRQNPGTHGAPRPPPQGLQTRGRAARRCPVSQGQLHPEALSPNLLGRVPSTGTRGQRSPLPTPLEGSPHKTGRMESSLPPIKSHTRNLDFFLLCVRSSVWGKKPLRLVRSEGPSITATCAPPPLAGWPRIRGGHWPSLSQGGPSLHSPPLCFPTQKTSTSQTAAGLLFVRIKVRMHA
ncbi:leucine-rich repeat-containing protein 71 isoform X3 [Ahaetulla prasina]|uniref:leucine-rich repeat-containing protein 71 isoform X3 n=1 Tax=Ahaetulla prasina TaxID=499056 RepID=UPI0026473178|nr:leucine-rich repeat-containing protein 71 isoform X3 [Ahaetulla prasina]